MLAMSNKLNAKVNIPVFSQDFSEKITELLTTDRFGILNNSKYTILPGFCDVHVHFREPGFSYKETIKTGSYAAAHGGYTDVCTMPNLSPVPDSSENLRIQTDIIRRDAVINVHPYGAITKGELGHELSDMDDIGGDVIAFSDDGHGVQSDGMMEKAMKKAKELGKCIVAHCEDNSLLNGGYIHMGDYAEAHGHRGICSESEYGQIARDLELAKKTGCSYDVCHISAKESVDVIRKYKREGVDVTCETAPHYLLLDDSMLEEDGKYKINPPIRSKYDRCALLDGIMDGTIDMIATDHAPHTSEEKSRGLEKSAFGASGIEIAFPLMYTYLVKEGIISMERLLNLLAYSPRKRFGIPMGTDFSVWDLNSTYRISGGSFCSMGKITPFEGYVVSGRCLATFCNGEAAYVSDEVVNI